MPNPGRGAGEPLRSSSVVRSSERREEQQTAWKSHPEQPRMGCQGKGSPKSSPIPARRRATTNTNSEAEPAPPERRGLLRARGVWRINHGSSSTRQHLASEGAGDPPGLLQRQREHRCSRGRRAPRHKPQDSPCLPCFSSPGGFQHQHLQKPLGSPEEFGAQM